MPAYNPFPVGYNPYNLYGPYQPQQMQQVQQPQAMTPPTIHADIIQVESEAEADRYPMAANQPPQMFMTQDETTIIIKTMLANNQHDLKVYPLRPPAPPVPPVDLGAYVTRQELEERLSALLAAPQMSTNALTKEAE